jgi:hypothetical protein
MYTVGLPFDTTASAFLDGATPCEKTLEANMNNAAAMKVALLILHLTLYEFQLKVSALSLG